MLNNPAAISGSKTELTQERVLELFAYRDGMLFWRVGKSNRVKPGDKAGATDKNGYNVIYVDYAQHLAHRIIWLMHNGWLPKYIDHINGNPNDNRIENLRPATQSQNNYNQRVRRNSKSGIKGVTWNKSLQSWKVVIQSGDKSIYLGYYKALDEATRVIREHRVKFHGEFARHD